MATQDFKRKLTAILSAVTKISRVLTGGGKCTNANLYEIERKWQKNQGTVEPLDCK